MEATTPAHSNGSWHQLLSQQSAAVAHGNNHFTGSTQGSALILTNEFTQPTRKCWEV